MSTQIKYKGSPVVTFNKGTVRLKTDDFGLEGDIEVVSDGNEGGGSPLPIEVATESEMNTVLGTAEVGSVYKYIGTSGTYENGALYVVEAVT